MKLTPERLDELETECAETGASLSVVTRPELLALIAAARREATARESERLAVKICDAYKDARKRVDDEIANFVDAVGVGDYIKAARQLKDTIAATNASIEGAVTVARTALTENPDA